MQLCVHTDMVCGTCYVWGQPEPSPFGTQGWLGLDFERVLFLIGKIWSVHSWATPTHPRDEIVMFLLFLKTLVRLELPLVVM